MFIYIRIYKVNRIHHSMSTISLDLEECIKSKPLEILGQFPESIRISYQENESYLVTYMGWNPRIIPDVSTNIGYLRGTTKNPLKILMAFLSFAKVAALDSQTSYNSLEKEFDD